MMSLEQKNNRINVASEVLNNPEKYKQKVIDLVRYFNEQGNNVSTILSLESNGIIEINYEGDYKVLPLTVENWESAKRILLKYYNILFGDVLTEDSASGIEREARDYVSGVFSTIICERKCGIEVFHPFVLELYNTWVKNDAEGGNAIVFGVRKNPTFMGELLAKFVMEGKAEGIDFTKKKFPLKETVAKHYLGKLWKQKMLFLELLQKLREEKKIPHKVIEQFVDKTFANSEKKTFIIKAFVEMAKNRGFKLGEVPSHLQKTAETFISCIRGKSFSEELTECEMMQGVEGFDWGRAYAVEKEERVPKIEEKRPSVPANKEEDSKKDKLNEKFNTLMQLIGERKEISIVELGKLMKKAGYSGRPEYAWNGGFIAGPTVEKVIKKIEPHGIRIMHKYNLSEEEKELILEKAKGKESVERKEIKKWLMENGRVLEGFVGKAVDEGMLLLGEQYTVKGKMKAPGRERRKVF